jgi:hypothetical protein
MVRRALTERGTEEAAADQGSGMDADPGLAMRQFGRDTRSLSTTRPSPAGKANGTSGRLGDGRELTA